MVARHDLLRRFRAAADLGDLMAWPAAGCPPSLSSRRGQFSPPAQASLAEGRRALGGDVLDPPKADPTAPRPRCSAATATMALLSTSRPRLPSPGRPHRFRRLRSRGQGGRGRAAPGPPHPVRPGPGGLVAGGPRARRSPRALIPFFASSRTKSPGTCPQRHPGAFESRAGGYRGLPAACPAPPPATGHFPRLADDPTAWAAKTGRPSAPADIGAASDLIPKPYDQCLEGAPGRHRPPPDALGFRPSPISSRQQEWRDTRA